MTSLVVTLDLDWACEAAIEETISFFIDKKIKLTVFSTHNSKLIESHMDELDVGLHPFFGENSSHGNSIQEVVKNVLKLPHNLKAFRCHRFGLCNLSKEAMVEAGMMISSNVCTDLECIQPFKDRTGLLEMPVFFEDGGYLWQKHPLEISSDLIKKLVIPAPKVLLIHPMHFVINTPHFDYMKSIKMSLKSEEWQQLTSAEINKLRWQGRGIRDLIIDLLCHVPETISLKALYHNVLKQRAQLEQLPEPQN